MKFLILSCAQIMRGSQAECDFTLVINLSMVWYPVAEQQATKKAKDAIQHNVIMHFGFPGNRATNLGSFYSSPVYCMLANHKVQMYF